MTRLDDLCVPPGTSDSESFGRCVFSHWTDLNYCCLSPDGRMLAAVGDHQGRLCKASSLFPVQFRASSSAHPSAADMFEIDNGSYRGLPDYGPALRAARHDFPLPPVRPSDSVYYSMSVSWSPDGRLLASASEVFSKHLMTPVLNLVCSLGIFISGTLKRTRCCLAGRFMGSPSNGKFAA